MYKKMIWLAALIAFLSIESQQPQDRFTPEDFVLKKEVELLKGSLSFFKRPELKGSMVRSVVAGLATFGGAAYVLISEEGLDRLNSGSLGAFSFVGTAFGMGVGVVYGALDSFFSGKYYSYKRSAQVKQINEVLAVHTHYTFARLPLRHSMLILAAFQQDKDAVQRWVHRLPDFMEISGVWNVVTQLYYQNEPTSDLVQQMKEVVNSLSP